MVAFSSPCVIALGSQTLFLSAPKHRSFVWLLDKKQTPSFFSPSPHPPWTTANQHHCRSRVLLLEPHWTLINHLQLTRTRRKSQCEGVLFGNQSAVRREEGRKKTFAIARNKNKVAIPISDAITYYSFPSGQASTPLLLFIAASDGLFFFYTTPSDF